MSVVRRIAVGENHKSAEVLNRPTDDIQTLSGLTLGATFPGFSTKTDLATLLTTSGFKSDLSDFDGFAKASGSFSGKLNVYAVQSGEVGVTSTQYAPGHVMRYGALGDGTTDDSAAIQRALTYAQTVGITVTIPKPASFFRVVSTLTLTTGGIQIVGTGLPELRMVTANTPLFSISASNVAIRGLNMTGPQFAALQTNSTAVKVIGASAASPATDITVENCVLDTWGDHGVYLQYVNDCDVSANKVTNIYYAGIGTASTLRGTISRNRVRNIVGTPNAYGIYVSRLSTASLVTDPRSADIAITANVVKDVTNWEGIDTHAGQGIVITGNRVKGCNTSIVVGGQTDGVNPAFAPLDVTVSGNVVDSGLTTGAAGYGIAFVGAAGTVGSPVERATGTISGNVIRGHGAQATGGAGALYLHDTMAVAITGNTFIEPSPFAIILSNDNTGTTITGNTAVDPWSTAYSFPGFIQTTADYNIGISVSGNVLAVGSKSATNKNVWGVRIGATQPNTTVRLGDNDFSAASSPYSIATAAALVSTVHASPHAIGSSTTAAASGVKQHLTGTATWDPASLTNGTQTTTTVTVTGALIGDVVSVGFAVNLQGQRLTGYVSASNTVTVVLRNDTGGTLDLGSGTLRASVWQY